jgi:hypothetical protein
MIEMKWKIQYDGRSLSIAPTASKHERMTTSILDEEHNNTVLAEYGPPSDVTLSYLTFSYKKYHMDVYSNEIPHIVYFLYIVVRDRASWQKG